MRILGVEKAIKETGNRTNLAVDSDTKLSSTSLLQAISSKMSASVPPGDINTQPNAKIVFNSPYDDKHTYHIKVSLLAIH